MSSFLGLKCDKVPLRDILLSAGSAADFFASFVKFPDGDMQRHMRFFNSKLFLLSFVWFVCVKVSWELAHMMSAAFGVRRTVMLLVHVPLALYMLVLHGYECALFMLVLLFAVYKSIILLLPAVAKGKAGDVVPALKKIPATTGKKSGVSQCERLAVCRSTPVYDNHRFQRGKHQKCMECASRNERIVFDADEEGCGHEERDVDAERCFKCTEGNSPDFSSCDYSDEECADVLMSLEFIDPDGALDGRRVCRDAEASLCWFYEDQGEFRGWNADRGFRLDDAGANGHGFPTRELCEARRAKTTGGGAACQRLGPCRTGVLQKELCACEDYRDNEQHRDPCAVFERGCDDSSLEYREAALRIRQGGVSVSDVVSADDVDDFVGSIEDVVNTVF